MNDPRLRRFLDDAYAMFIHWGLYSHLGGEYQGKIYHGIGEWIMHSAMAGIPVEEYKALAREFNPIRFDASCIARLARDAGFRPEPDPGQRRRMRYRTVEQGRLCFARAGLQHLRLAPVGTVREPGIQVTQIIIQPWR